MKLSIQSVGIILLAVAFLMQPQSTEAFTTVAVTSQKKSNFLAAKESSNENKNPVDELSEKRKANLFQFLLRDLEIEGVPLLEVDVDQAHTFQAATYTIMAQLSQQDEEGKACLILQDMPIECLTNFVEDFESMKSDDLFSELQRFNVSLVGRGVGPAIVLESSERSDDQVKTYDSLQASFPIPEEDECTATMKSFVTSKSIIRETDDNDDSLTAYRVAGGTDLCDTLSVFWTCICELLSQPKQHATVMSLPPITVQQFSKVANVIGNSFFTYRGQDIFELLYLVPSKSNNNSDRTNDLLLTLENCESGSPYPGIVIRRL
jgi:hypothetical protein